MDSFWKRGMAGNAQEIHVFHHFDDEIVHLLRALLAQGEKMSKELDDLTAEVAAETTVEASAVTLIQGLAAQITAAGTDPAKLAALTTQIKTSSDALAAAVAANTPAAPPAPAPAAPAK
jgi:hypothetical protein